MLRLAEIYNNLSFYCIFRNKIKNFGFINAFSGLNLKKV